MSPSRRIVLYGNSIALAGIALNCAHQPGLEIVTIDTGDPAAAQRLQELATDVVIFDLAESRADLTISLLRARAGLLLLGVDPSRNEMLVLSGHPERVLSTQELLQVVNRKGVAQPGEPKEDLLSRRKPGIVHNIYQSKPAPLIAREEPEMKNLSQRNKVLLVIAGVLVVVVIAVVVFFQASGEDLFGTLINISISPSSSTIVVGQSKTLSSSTSLSNCSWSSSNTSVASITSSSTKSATVRGNAVGTATITETCGAMGRYKGSASVTVNPAPTPTPVPPTPTPAPPPVITLAPDTGKSVPVIGGNERMTLCANDASATWDIASSNPANAVTLLGSMYARGCIVVEGVDGYAYVRATNAAGGKASVRIDVITSLTMSPAYPTMTVGQSITMTMTGADSASVWSIFKGCESTTATCPVRLSATTGQSVTITGQAKGAVLIRCDRMPQLHWLNDSGLTQVIVQ